MIDLLLTAKGMNESLAEMTQLTKHIEFIQPLK